MDIRNYLFVNKLISEVGDSLSNRLWKAYNFEVVGKTYQFELYSIATGERYKVNVNIDGVTFSLGVPKWLTISLIKIIETCWSPEYWKNLIYG